MLEFDALDKRYGTITALDDTSFTVAPGRLVGFLGPSDGATRLIVDLAAKGADRSTTALAHERLPDARTAEERKAFWRERMAAERIPRGLTVRSASSDAGVAANRESGYR